MASDKGSDPVASNEYVNLDRRQSSQARIIGVVIARSHRASKDGRLSTGFGNAAIEEAVGHPALP